MRLRSRLLRFSLIAGWLSLMAAAAPVRGFAQTPPTITIGASTDDIVRPMLYAVDAGLFKKAGLDVQIVKLLNGAAVAAAVASGALDLGKGSALTPVLAYSRGIPFTAVANLGNYTSDAPNIAMLVRRDSPLSGPKDLAGKTIGMIGLQDQNAIAIDVWLEQNGVDLATVKFVEVGNAAGLGALETGRVDAVMAQEPALSSDIASGNARIFGYPGNALGKRYSIGILFGTTAWVGAHRDVVDTINRVLRDASAYVAAHENETKPLAAQFAGIDPATLQNFRPPERAMSLGPSDLQSTIDGAAKYKLIPKAFPARDLICECAIGPH